MKVSPQRLKEKDFDAIHRALMEFYIERPVNYGLLERPQSVYSDYANFIANIIKQKNRKILDIGSGTWRIPDSIAEYGFKEVVGLDYFSEEKILEYSAKLTNKNARLVSYQGDTIPFENEYFDAVSSLCVLEHIIFVDNFLKEIHRVLKPNGYVIILCPNWSGINVYITGLIHILTKKDRFWQLNNFFDAFSGIFRSLIWYFENLISKEPRFILIYPRMKNGKIDFERSDDDAVHLCQPLSIKKFFKKLNYEVIHYNRGFGSTKYTLIFNKIFPSLASTNVLVFQKKIS